MARMPVQTTTRIPPAAERTSTASAAARVAHLAAATISVAASPFLVLPLFAGLITARYSPDIGRFLLWTALSGFFSTGITLLYIVVRVRSGQISDIHVMHREQRGGPFGVALASSAAGALVLHLVGAPLPVVVLGVATVANGVVFALITLRWKISMHPSVFAAAVLSAAYLLDGAWAWLLALLPVIVWARIRRTRHSAAQGIVAVGLALAITFLILQLFGFRSVP